MPKAPRTPLTANELITALSENGVKLEGHDSAFHLTETFTGKDLRRWTGRMSDTQMINDLRSAHWIERVQYLHGEEKYRLTRNLTRKLVTTIGDGYLRLDTMQLKNVDPSSPFIQEEVNVTIRNLAKRQYLLVDKVVTNPNGLVEVTYKEALFLRHQHYPKLVILPGLNLTPAELLQGAVAEENNLALFRGQLYRQLADHPTSYSPALVRSVIESAISERGELGKLFKISETDYQLMRSSEGGRVVLSPNLKYRYFYDAKTIYFDRVKCDPLDFEKALSKAVQSIGRSPLQKITAITFKNTPAILLGVSATLAISNIAEASEIGPVALSQALNREATDFTNLMTSFTLSAATGLAAQTYAASGMAIGMTGGAFTGPFAPFCVPLFGMAGALAAPPVIQLWNQVMPEVTLDDIRSTFKKLYTSPAQDPSSTARRDSGFSMLELGGAICSTPEPCIPHNTTLPQQRSDKEPSPTVYSTLATQMLEERRMSSRDRANTAYHPAINRLATLKAGLQNQTPHVAAVGSNDTLAGLVEAAFAPKRAVIEQTHHGFQAASTAMLISSSAKAPIDKTISRPESSLTRVTNSFFVSSSEASRSPFSDIADRMRNSSQGRLDRSLFSQPVSTTHPHHYFGGETPNRHAMFAVANAPRAVGHYFQSPTTGVTHHFQRSVDELKYHGFCNK